jgi:acyl carrier protein
MSDITSRLANCFQIVFPDLPPTAIVAAAQHSVPGWDSTGAITLINVIEEEFDIQLDFDAVAELDSFHRILEYLRKELQAS